MALDQAARLLGLNTPLGDNELLLTRFRGQESISQLFRFELDMISDDNAIKPNDIVGKSVTFWSIDLTIHVAFSTASLAGLRQETKTIKSVVITERRLFRGCGS